MKKTVKERRPNGTVRNIKNAETIVLLVQLRSLEKKDGLSKMTFYSNLLKDPIFKNKYQMPKLLDLRDNKRNNCREKPSGKFGSVFWN